MGVSEGGKNSVPWKEVIILMQGLEFSQHY